MSLRAARRSGRYRAGIAARVLAATGGSYVIAALFAFAGARLFPLPRLDAIIPATLIAFLLLPAVAIWAFLARSATRAWGGILAVAASLALVAWAVGAPA